MARAQARHKLAGQPYGIEDLEESEQHDLVDVAVPAGDYLDCVTDAGLEAVGLPDGYPRIATAALSSTRTAGRWAAAARARGQPGRGVPRPRLLRRRMARSWRSSTPRRARRRA